MYVQNLKSASVNEIEGHRVGDCKYWDVTPCGLVDV